MDESQQEEEMNEMKLAEGVRLLYNKPPQPGRKVYAHCLSFVF